MRLSYNFALALGLSQLNGLVEGRAHPQRQARRAVHKRDTTTRGSTTTTHAASTTTSLGRSTTTTPGTPTSASEVFVTSSSSEISGSGSTTSASRSWTSDSSVPTTSIPATYHSSSDNLQSSSSPLASTTDAAIGIPTTSIYASSTSEVLTSSTSSLPASVTSASETIPSPSTSAAASCPTTVAGVCGGSNADSSTCSSPSGQQLDTTCGIVYTGTGVKVTQVAIGKIKSKRQSNTLAPFLAQLSDCQIACSEHADCHALNYLPGGLCELLAEVTGFFLRAGALAAAVADAGVPPITSLPQVSDPAVSTTMADQVTSTIADIPPISTSESPTSTESPSVPADDTTSIAPTTTQSPDITAIVTSADLDVSTTDTTSDVATTTELPVDSSSTTETALPTSSVESSADDAQPTSTEITISSTATGAPATSTTATCTNLIQNGDFEDLVAPEGTATYEPHWTFAGGRNNEVDVNSALAYSGHNMWVGVCSAYEGDHTPATLTQSLTGYSADTLYTLTFYRRLLYTDLGANGESCSMQVTLGGHPIWQEALDTEVKYEAEFNAQKWILRSVPGIAAPATTAADLVFAVSCPAGTTADSTFMMDKVSFLPASCPGPLADAATTTFVTTATLTTTTSPTTSTTTAVCVPDSILKNGDFESTRGTEGYSVAEPPWTTSAGWASDFSVASNWNPPSGTNIYSGIAEGGNLRNLSGVAVLQQYTADFYAPTTYTLSFYRKLATSYLDGGAFCTYDVLWNNAKIFTEDFSTQVKYYDEVVAQTWELKQVSGIESPAGPGYFAFQLHCPNGTAAYAQYAVDSISLTPDCPSTLEPSTSLPVETTTATSTSTSVGPTAISDFVTNGNFESAVDNTEGWTFTGGAFVQTNDAAGPLGSTNNGTHYAQLSPTATSSGLIQASISQTLSGLDPSSTYYFGYSKAKHFNLYNTQNVLCTFKATFGDQYLTQESWNGGAQQYTFFADGFEFQPSTASGDLVFEHWCNEELGEGDFSYFGVDSIYFVPRAA